MVVHSAWGMRRTDGRPVEGGPRDDVLGAVQDCATMAMVSLGRWTDYLTSLCLEDGQRACLNIVALETTRRVLCVLCMLRRQ
jgi:hypothetical protein